MKISKALLGAILVGVTVQATATSCTKKNNDSLKNGEVKTAEAQQQPQPQPPYDCPACGMG